MDRISGTQIEKYQHKYSLSGFETLRRRWNSNIPCNHVISDEDAYLRGRIMETVECIPAFWRRFISNSNSLGILPSCTQRQYREVKKIFKTSVFHNQHPIIQCNETSAIIYHSSKMRPENKPDSWDISFHYTTDWYRDVLNKQAYTLETLVGQVGGFEGKGK
jgi:hypothetical protein